MNYYLFSLHNLLEMFYICIQNILASLPKNAFSGYFACHYSEEMTYCMLFPTNLFSMMTNRIMIVDLTDRYTCQFVVQQDLISVQSH